jgi:GrpB-like predicted nucleotidyltransferase (UPF0157 family)
MAVDALADMTDALIAAGLEVVVVRRVAREVRTRWGGSAVYIHAVDRAARDETAREALARGASIQEAARAAECSPSTIRRRRSEWF